VKKNSNGQFQCRFGCGLAGLEWFSFRPPPPEKLCNSSRQIHSSSSKQSHSLLNSPDTIKHPPFKFETIVIMSFIIKYLSNRPLCKSFQLVCHSFFNSWYYYSSITQNLFFMSLDSRTRINVYAFFLKYLMSMLKKCIESWIELEGISCCLF
jgi:hypothetical protein